MTCLSRVLYSITRMIVKVIVKCLALRQFGYARRDGPHDVLVQGIMFNYEDDVQGSPKILHSPKDMADFLVWLPQVLKKIW